MLLILYLALHCITILICLPHSLTILILVQWRKTRSSIGVTVLVQSNEEQTIQLTVFNHLKRTHVFCSLNGWQPPIFTFIDITFHGMRETQAQQKRCPTKAHVEKSKQLGLVPPC